MRIATALLLLFTIMGSVYGQQGWLWQGETPHGQAFTVVSVLHVQNDAANRRISSLAPMLDTMDILITPLELNNKVYTGIFDVLTDTRMDDQLPEAEYKKLSAYMKKHHGFKPEYFATISPAFIYLMMTEAGMGQKQETPFMDQLLQDNAEAAGTELVPLTDMKEMSKAFSAVPHEEELKPVLTIVEQDYTNGYHNRVVRAFNKHRPKRVWRKQKRQLHSKAFYLAYRQFLFTLAERIDTELAKRNGKAVLVALSPFQLMGKDGLFELLEAKGYTFEPVNVD